MTTVCRQQARPVMHRLSVVRRTVTPKSLLCRAATKSTKHLYHRDLLKLMTRAQQVMVTILSSRSKNLTEVNVRLPFHSLPSLQMLRPGSARWDFGVGELNDDSLAERPKIGYGTLYYGINNTFTGYAGVQYSDMDFYAGIAGWR